MPTRVTKDVWRTNTGKEFDTRLEAVECEVKDRIWEALENVDWRDFSIQDLLDNAETVGPLLMKLVEARRPPEKP